MVGGEGSEDNGGQLCEDFMSIADICIFSMRHAGPYFINEDGKSAR
jgi:hypothetical protein